jgi:hypothetical protein
MQRWAAAGAKNMQQRAAVWPQIGAGERACIPAREAKRMQRRAAVWLQIGTSERAFLFYVI